MSGFVDQVKNIQRRVGVAADGKFGPATAVAVWRELNKDSAECQVISDQEDFSGLDGRTVSNIATLDPKCRENFAQFARLAKATAATLGCDYVMISGNRSYAEQDALYAQGRTKPGKIVTKARGGYSNHNFGIAGDFGVFRAGAYLDDTDAAFAAKVHKACSVHALACGLLWGGSWSGFVDLPHYEEDTGLTMTEKRARMAARGAVL